MSSGNRTNAKSCKPRDQQERFRIGKVTTWTIPVETFCQRQKCYIDTLVCKNGVINYKIMASSSLLPFVSNVLMITAGEVDGSKNRTVGFQRYLSALEYV